MYDYKGKQNVENYPLYPRKCCMISKDRPVWNHFRHIQLLRRVCSLKFFMKTKLQLIALWYFFFFFHCRFSLLCLIISWWFYFTDKSPQYDVINSFTIQYSEAAFFYLAFFLFFPLWFIWQTNIYIKNSYFTLGINNKCMDLNCKWQRNNTVYEVWSSFMHPIHILHGIQCADQILHHIKYIFIDTMSPGLLWFLCLLAAIHRCYVHMIMS